MYETSDPSDRARSNPALWRAQYSLETTPWGATYAYPIRPPEIDLMSREDQKLWADLNPAFTAPAGDYWSYLGEAWRARERWWSGVPEPPRAPVITQILTDAEALAERTRIRARSGYLPAVDPPAQDTGMVTSEPIRQRIPPVDTSGGPPIVIQPSSTTGGPLGVPAWMWIAGLAGFLLLRK